MTRGVKNRFSQEKNDLPRGNSISALKLFLRPPRLLLGILFPHDELLILLQLASVYIKVAMQVFCAGSLATAHQFLVLAPARHVVDHSSGNLDSVHVQLCLAGEFA